MTDDTKVMRTEVMGTGLVVYGAWEPFDGHGTIWTIGDRRMGRIGTRRLPAELDALKSGSDERYIRVSRWHNAQNEEAYGVIRDAVDPAEWELSHSTGGEIEVRAREGAAV